MYADSKEDFCCVRFADILARRGADMLAVLRAQVAKVITHKVFL